uniref:DUF4200 domain-containing protein n=1 Tax=Nothobranchius furzeri TaxID=105023 RepID=A0A8C6NIT6_NOTFU
MPRCKPTFVCCSSVPQLSLMTKRSDIMKMDKALAKEERMLKVLERTIESENQKFEEFLKENERKSVEARTLGFEKHTTNKCLLCVCFGSEIANFEEILIDYKRYQEFLFKISPPEWQEEQRAKAWKVKDQIQELHEADTRNSECFLKDMLTWSHKYTTLASVGTRSARGPASADDDEAELYFTDPQQLLDLITELTDQSLFLIQNTARVEDVLKQLQQSIETTRREIEKVAEVHRSCVDDRVTNLSTLERVVGIENRVLSLLQSLEDVPQDRLDMIKKVKDSEKRSRQREEKLREQKEKQQERMKKYLERSLADSKKIVRKLLSEMCLTSSEVSSATS